MRQTTKYMLVLLTLAFCVMLFCGCSASDVLVKLDESALTQEAQTLFASLNGEQGVMLYGDPAQLTNRKIRMYAVLYGESGQELELSHKMSHMIAHVGGEAGAGYTVWKIEYNPLLVRQLSFYKDGAACEMDGYAELPCVAETALLKAKE